MNSSVRQSLRCRAISAFDLLFLQKKSLLVPIHQNSSLLLSTLKKPADQPLHVSTSVENLKFKCEAAAMSTVMKKKKNITGAYLATRWALPNALALAPYPTLYIMTPNLSPGKAGYASRPSIRGFFSSHPRTEVINETDRDIAFLIEQPGKKPYSCLELEAGKNKGIGQHMFEQLLDSLVPTTVIIAVGSKRRGRINVDDFTKHEKLRFYIDGDGKLAGEKLLDKDRWAKLEIH